MTRTAADWMLCVIDAYGGGERLALSIERSVRLAIADRIDRFAEGRYVSPQLLADPSFVRELQRLAGNLRFRRLRKDWRDPDYEENDDYFGRIDCHLHATLDDLSIRSRRPIARGEAEERWTPSVVDRVAWLLRWEAKIALAARTARNEQAEYDEARTYAAVCGVSRPGVSIEERAAMVAYWLAEAKRLRSSDTFYDAYENQLLAIEGEL